ncbi:TRAF-interacting protein [Cricetulus griseus]|nr:TRAF-interacting protein [Cricetulus griseus]
MVMGSESCVQKEKIYYITFLRHSATSGNVKSSVEWTAHDECLIQWFETAPSRTCPQCRIQCHDFTHQQTGLAKKLSSISFSLTLPRKRRVYWMQNS